MPITVLKVTEAVEGSFWLISVGSNNSPLIIDKGEKSHILRRPRGVNEDTLNTEHTNLRDAIRTAVLEELDRWLWPEAVKAGDNGHQNKKSIN